MMVEVEGVTEAYEKPGGASIYMLKRYLKLLTP